MREIEIKSNLTNKLLAIKELKNIGAIFRGTVFQHDKIFLHKNDNNLLKLSEGSSVLRIRKEIDKTEITIKVHKSSELDCLEENLQIFDDSYDNAERLIILLGYKEVIQVKKERSIYILNKYSICIDSVENLGDFIEIELLTNESESLDLKKSRKEMKAVLSNLGIKKKDFVSQGYDTLIYLKNDVTHD